MVEAVTVYRVGERVFTSAAEATQFESEIVIRPLVETGPFVSVPLGIHWLTANAAAVIAALSPSVPKARKAARDPNAPKRGRRSRAEIDAAKATAATQSVAEDIEQSMAA